MHMIRKAWAAVGVMAAVTLGLAAPAHAVTPRAEGTFPVFLSGCAINEEIQLQGSPAHDYMRWITHGPSSGCHVEIDRNGTVLQPRNITDDGLHYSDWVYDGPGYTAEVCVSNVSHGACGPAN